MERFKQIDISGDVGLRVFGQSVEALFANAAAGMFELITDVSAIPESEERKVVVTAENDEDLFIQWLNELVFLYDTYGFIGKRISVCIEGHASPSRPADSGAAVSLRAAIRGGLFDADIHERRLLIKAATYHNLTLGKRDSGWQATVIFDI